MTAARSFLPEMLWFDLQATTKVDVFGRNLVVIGRGVEAKIE